MNQTQKKQVKAALTIVEQLAIHSRAMSSPEKEHGLNQIKHQRKTVYHISANSIFKKAHADIVQSIISAQNAILTQMANSDNPFEFIFQSKFTKDVHILTVAFSNIKQFADAK